MWSTRRHGEGRRVLLRELVLYPVMVASGERAVLHQPGNTENIQIRIGLTGSIPLETAFWWSCTPYTAHQYNATTVKED